MGRRTRLVLVCTLGLLFLLAGCGKVPGEKAADQTGALGEGPRSPGELADQSEQEAATSAGQDTAGVAGTLVALSQTALGPILVDERGFTLYLLTDDLPNTPSCYGGCADIWLPLLTSAAPQAAGGVDSSLLGSAARRDGSLQVTYSGWPLYLYRGDSSPGQTNGQGQSAVWYAISPSGEPLREAAAEQEPTTEGGGYYGKDY